MTDQALREQIAQALFNFHDSSGRAYSRRYYCDIADAVLPVVQAHERDLIEEIEELAVELAEERADLSSLRSAVAQAVDEVELEAAAARDRDWPGMSDHVKYGFSRFADGCDSAARRLRRSLLPQEGQE